MKEKHNFCELGTAVIDTELDAIKQLKSKMNNNFSKACELMLACKGRVIVTGMGKSGHISSKIAATLASTGTPAFFVHPGEASHGDLGMITKNDVLLAISYSGKTRELITILPLLKRLNVPLIAMTGDKSSTLAKMASVHIDVSVEKEACPLNLAPTSSTTAALVLGDALAIALLDARGFTAEDFARSHPGGALGRKLLVKIEDLMHAGKLIPKVKKDTLIKDALIEMTGKHLGMTAIIDDEEKIIGLYTDGDIRRTLDGGFDIQTTPIEKVMTKNPIVCHTDMLAAELLQIMEEKRINGIVVVDKDNKIIGALNTHDLLRAGAL
jgi:arabinose-5-phosphate isomerase